LEHLKSSQAEDRIRLEAATTEVKATNERLWVSEAERVNVEQVLERVKADLELSERRRKMLMEKYLLLVDDVDKMKVERESVSNA